MRAARRARRTAWLAIRAAFVSAPVCCATGASAKGRVSSLVGMSSGGSPHEEHGAELHGEGHVAGDLDLAAHERLLRLELAGGEVGVVGRGEGDGAGRVFALDG